KGHGVEGIEILGSPLARLLGDGGAVRSEDRFPLMGALSEVVKRGHGRGDRVVLITFALPDHQESPLLGLSEGRVRRPQPNGQYQDVPNHAHQGLPKSTGDSARRSRLAAGWGDLPLAGTDSDSIKSRMNSAASRAFS